MHRLEAEASRDDLAGEPVEQFGVRRLPAVEAEVARRLDEPGAEVCLPKTVHHHRAKRGFWELAIQKASALRRADSARRPPVQTRRTAPPLPRPRLPQPPRRLGWDFLGYARASPRLLWARPHRLCTTGEPSESALLYRGRSRTGRVRRDGLRSRPRRYGNIPPGGSGQTYDHGSTTQLTVRPRKVWQTVPITSSSSSLRTTAFIAWLCWP